jgi:serine/threonine protein phosphatase 1
MSVLDIEFGGKGLPAGERIYAIGDIHGRSDLLESLHEQIAADWSAGAAERGVVVYLGDYVDRGYDSRGVVDMLLQGPPCGLEAVFLIGNHEQFMLDLLDGGSSRLWLANGGRETLLSYGLDEQEICEGDDGRLRQLLSEALPDRHEAFLRSLAAMHLAGDYCFVHAGVRPGVPLERQDRDEVIWIRDHFLMSDADFGKIVVHGHTIVREVAWRRNRIGIDTGAFYSGRLTCLVLEGADRRLLQT